ncbi:MAG: peptidyl-prolyl cis-trans isomerase [Proteobacteria bacterium]|nr:peptidyl-prolyl cis-trans isomerase [Pseudomonadota bacterium]
MNQIIKNLSREPLLYFLLLGAAMFVTYHWVSDAVFPGTEQLEEIVIPEGQVGALILGFEKVWQRLPTQQEQDGLLQGYIREEVMYREALVMGLDRDDAIIRRRLQQKLEFLTDDIASLDEPTEEELQTFLTENLELFREQARFSFEHIYFNVSERGASAMTDAKSTLIDLQQLNGSDGGERPIATADPSRLGDQLLMLETRFHQANELEIRRALGSQFFDQLQSLSTGSWQGPLESGFGLHLVYVSSHIEGYPPQLADVLNAVTREWTSRKRTETNEAFYAAMRNRYIVTVAEPDVSSPPAASTIPRGN